MLVRAMLVRIFAIAAVVLPLAVIAGDKGSSGTTSGTTDSSEGKPRTGSMDDSTPGHGHAAGALGNSSDTTGAKGAGGAGTNSGTSGSKGERAAGEGGDTTSGAASGRWDESGGRTDDRSGHGTASGGAGGMKGHGNDRTVTGKLSKVSGDSITIESGKGERHELKLVGQTMIRMDGKDASRAQLKEGQEVRASFSEQGGQPVAVRIEAGAAGKDATGKGGTGSAGAKPHDGTSSGSSTETKKSQ
jgi:hypothetical protein